MTAADSVAETATKILSVHYYSASNFESGRREFHQLVQ